MPPAPTIWIAIPTFRRPGQLRHLLESLATVVPHDDVQLLVADNDPVAQEGAMVAHEMQDDPDYPLPIHILHVPEPGLCSVRNAIVATALAAPAMQYLAMIDDDEWPQPGWLDALLACREMCGSDVIGGPVDAHFLRPPPHWAREALVFRAEERPSGATDMLWASNNLLLSRAALERLPAPWFDPRFNRSGGEDLDYLTRLRDAGPVRAAPIR